MISNTKSKTNYKSPTRMNRVVREELPPEDMEEDRQGNKKRAQPRRRLPNKFEEEAEDVDVVKILMNAPTNITVGQLLKAQPKLNTDLRRALIKKLDKGTNWLHSVELGKTKSLRCNININDQEIQAVIDTGAAANVISKPLLDKLDLEIQKKSNATFTLANGEKQASLGKATIEIETEDWNIPIKVDVIDSKRKELILGMPMLHELRGKIDIDKGKMVLTINNEEIELPIYHQLAQSVKNEETDDEIDEEIEEKPTDEYEETDEEFEALIITEINEPEDNESKND